MQGSSSYVQRVCADYEARAARVPRQKPPDVRIVFYNVGIHKSQVESEWLYDNWIKGKLRSAVHTAVFQHDADIIALSELGRLEEGLGPTLMTWKTSTCAAKPGAYHLVEDMLLDLVDDPTILHNAPGGLDGTCNG